MAIVIKDSIKRIEVTYPKGKKGVLSFDIGNQSNLQSWVTEILKIREAGEREYTNENALDEMIKAVEGVCVSVFGQKQWDNFWRRSNNNVEGAIDMLVEVFKICNKAIEELKITIAKIGEIKKLG